MSVISNNPEIESTASVATGNEYSSRVSAFVELTKPRLSLMVIITFVVAGVLAAGAATNPFVLLCATIGMVLIASSGNAMNMYIERYTDCLMDRTAKRPLPSGRLSPSDVVAFSAASLAIAVVILLTCVNWQATACGLINWVLYVAVYTPLKQKTWFNTEVGAIAGALPILMGSLATSGTIAPLAWVLFGVLVLWQFPHFMAIAWMYRDQYQRGGHRMLTVVDPTGLRAGRKAVLTAVLLIAVSIAPAFSMELGWQMFTLIGASTVTGVLYLKAAIKFLRNRERTVARRLLRASLLYLPLYMIALVVTCLN